jgi:cytochrome P450
MLCGLYSLEVICQAGFAKEFTGPTATDDARHLLDLIDGSAAAFMYSASIPFASIRGVGSRLPGPIGASYRAFADWQQVSRDMVDHFLQHSSEETKYLLNPLSQSTDRFLNRKLAHNELVEEAMTYMFAGSGTTSTTLTYILYEIAKPNHRHIQDRLYQEVHGLQEGDITGLRNNEYVNAVIKETMRLHPTIISTLPRLLTEPMQLNNVCVPAGTIVGMQNWIHHRNPVVFPSPESFVPDRWLDATVEMESSLTPFGIGRRNCIGQNLAWQELYWAIDSLMRAGVQLELGVEMGNWEMEKIDRFNIAPRGKRLMLAVTKGGKI